MVAAAANTIRLPMAATAANRSVTMPKVAAVTPVRATPLATAYAARPARRSAAPQCRCAPIRAAMRPSTVAPR